MSSTNRFYMIAFLLAGAALFGARMYFFQSHAVDTIRVAKLPFEIGEWSGTDQPLDKRTYELFGTDNVLMRNYAHPSGYALNLYIIYSADNRKVTHPPEICLSGTGASVAQKGPLRIIPGVQATMLIIEKDKTRDIVVYWYRAGKEGTNSYLHQQARVTAGRITEKPISVSTVRIIAEIGERNPEETLEMIRKFCFAIEPLLDQYLP